MKNPLMVLLSGLRSWNKPGSAAAHKAIKSNVAASHLASADEVTLEKNNCPSVCRPVELKGALTAASSALLMPSSSAEAIMPPFFSRLQFSGRRPTVFKHTSVVKARKGSG